jgi:hypothetical protein
MAEFVITNVSRQELQKLIDESVAKSLQQYFKNEKSSIDEYFDVPGTAVFLGIAISTLHNYCSNRLIPHIKRGGKLYFRKSDLEQWLMEGYRQSTYEIVDKVNLNLSKRRKRPNA